MERSRFIENNICRFPSTSRRAPLPQSNGWQQVKSRRTIREERRKEKAGLNTEEIWAIPITTRVPVFATNANRVPLGLRNSEWPHLGMQGKHAEGFIKPSRVREPISWRNSNDIEEKRTKTRAEQVMQRKKQVWINTNQPKPKPDIITSTNTELRDFCEKHGLFAKWEGKGQSSSDIAEWWRKEYRGKEKDEIQKEFDKIMDNLMGNFAEELAKEVMEKDKTVENTNLEGDLNNRMVTIQSEEMENKKDEEMLDMQNIENLSPVVKGLSEEEERNYIIRELINMREEERDGELMEKQKESPNKGIMMTDEDKESPDYGKSNTNKRGRKSFLEMRLRDGEVEGQTKITNLFGPIKNPPTPNLE
ncbi:hypothetical protein SUGI_0209260 [Cryptomeria japonica]|nr:hypothetical protein SUGI_0209260 [Cryptomeria japonica]